MVQAERFKTLISDLEYGKSLPDAVYIYRPEAGEIAPELVLEIQRAQAAAKPASDWNLIKFHKHQTAISFLLYDGFWKDPHPALIEATKINLKTGTVIQTDYRGRSNPPILHRKETFLSPIHPRREEFATLTKQEELTGLYQQPTKIGYRQYWQALLRQKQLYYEGHKLVRRTDPVSVDIVENEMPPVARHRTAIKRYDLSKPVKQILEHGILRTNDTFFDYGCGHGMDIEALKRLGYDAAGWDPAFQPRSPKKSATIVNLGYVLNVIEEPRERISTLQEAYSLANRALVVSTMVTGQKTESHTRPYRDGFLTKTNTFQKFYASGELEGLIEQALDVEASTLGLGVCVIFKNDEDAELFEASRNRRRLDWTKIGAALKFPVPVSRERRNVDRYDLHEDLFDQFWEKLLELGRVPEVVEFDRLAEVAKAAGGISRALTIVIARKGEQLWQTARKIRTEDVLVYLALTNFRKRFLLREIPPRIKYDIRGFFGDFPSAQSRARDLLFSAGDPGEIELACQSVKTGWQDEGALMIHRSLLGELPPILRIYVHCAAFRYGDPSQADVIKIHKRSGKITFQHYDDFDGKPLPELQTRIKVNLRNLFVEVFDHSKGPRTQLLYFKERFVG